MPECTLHSRVKDSIIHISIVTLFSNIKGRLVCKCKFCFYIFMKKYYFVYEFSELEFKWSVHVINVLNQVHVIHTSFSYGFTFEVNNLFILWL